LPENLAVAAQRFDLALVVDCLEHLSKRAGPGACWAACATSTPAASPCWPTLRACGWKDTDFFSLALQSR
jgi:hypothetical protein